MNNYKRDKINLAKSEFINDLKSDKDFIEFKNNCRYNDGLSSYGCVLCYDIKYTINTIGESNQSLISEYRQYTNKILYGKKN